MRFQALYLQSLWILYPKQLWEADKLFQVLKIFCLCVCSSRCNQIIIFKYFVFRLGNFCLVVSLFEQSTGLCISLSTSPIFFSKPCLSKLYFVLLTNPRVNGILASIKLNLVTNWFYKLFLATSLPTTVLSLLKSAEEVLSSYISKISSFQASKISFWCQRRCINTCCSIQIGFLTWLDRSHATFKFPSECS